MQIRELSIPDSYEIIPEQMGDDRGVFLEWYRFDLLADVVGHPLLLAQANTSTSSKGVVRGIHYADVPPSQAKYVSCQQGAVLDFIVDIRVGSPTFGRWDSVQLDDVDRKAVYIAEGLGHAFVSLTEGAVVSYLVSATYSPGSEHGINPLDEEVSLQFPLGRDELLLSPKDMAAPSLAEAKASGCLPEWNAAKSYYTELDSGRR